MVAEVTEGAGLPAPGEGVEADVELDLRTGAITVPEEALVVSEGGSAVFVVEGGTARRARGLDRRPGGGGTDRGALGVAAGDKVVVGGADLLSDGAKVEAIDEPPAASTGKAEAKAAGKAGR